MMNLEEEKLLIEIVAKYDLDPNIFNHLFRIEKEYANKNPARRIGIYRDLKEIIDMWTME